MEEDNQSYTFSVQMTTQEVFRFSLHHSYFKWSGVLGVLMSLVSLFIFIFCFQDLGDQNKAVLLIVALWFTVLEPITIYSRAKGQAKRNSTYKKPLVYTLNQDGITVSQEEQSQSVEWKQLMKVVETSSQYLIYSSKVHAFVFPKAAMGTQREGIEKLIVKSTADTKVKVSRSMKKRNEKSF